MASDEGEESKGLPARDSINPFTAAIVGGGGRDLKEADDDDDEDYYKTGIIPNLTTPNKCEHGGCTMLCNRFLYMGFMYDIRCRS
jgi:hypothetical protein